MSDKRKASNYPAARAAANWWAEQVGAPTFVNTGERDSPKDRTNGAIAGAMQSILADRHPVSSEAGSAFADALAKHIEADLDERAKRGSDYGVSLSVDYGPDYQLAQIADKTGISYARFPWKTHMSVHPDYVIASLGYGREPSLIWSAPEWLRPVCGTHRYEGKQSFDEVCPLPKFHDEPHGNWQPDPARCEGCGLGYTGHYDGNPAGDWHAWKPVTTAEVQS